MGFRLLALATVLVLVLTGFAAASSTSPSRLAATPGASPAIDATPGFWLPGAPGITTTPLAAEVVDELPTAGADFDTVRLALTRTTLEAGAETGWEDSGAVELLYAERGDLVVAGSSGLEGLLRERRSLLLRGSTSYRVRNDSAQPTSYLSLRLSETFLEAAGTPPIQRNALPPAQRSLRAVAGFAGAGADLSAPPGPPTPGPEGVASYLLLAQDVAALPPAPALLFISRATWETDATLEEAALTGPFGLFVESGLLLVDDPSGFEARLEANQSFVYERGMPMRVWNGEQEPAVALVVGVVATT